LLHSNRRWWWMGVLQSE